jgi:hypothetical protein
MKIERRIACELRAAGRKLSGYAATFDTETNIGDFIELVKPGAFLESLRSGSDILALVDHEPSRLLARTASRTLHLAEDSKGLTFAIDMPDTQEGRDVLTLAERGDLGGMSFGFRVPKDGEVWQGKRRQLTKVELVEISVITAWPAYPDTIVQARAACPALLRAKRYLETIWAS